MNETHHRKIVDDYAAAVLDGSIVAGRLVRLAAYRYLDDLEHAGERGYYLSEFHGSEAINFIERCCAHYKGRFAGEPFLLQPWQKFIVWNLFGWRRREDDMRRFRRALIEIARKNGKSAMAAAFALLLLTWDNPLEEGAEIYCAATKEQQARIVHRAAKVMVDKSRPLRKRLRRLTKSIEFPQTNSFFQPIGSDSDSTDGLDTHGVIGDELHAWQERHRGLFERLTTAGGARQQPLVVFITTAGEERSRLWQEERQYVADALEASLKGEQIADNVFGYVASIDYHERPCPGCKKCKRRRRRHSLPETCDGSGTIAADDPFEDPGCLRKANPNVGVSVKMADLFDLVEEAKHKPTSRNALLRFHANVQVAGSERAITPELWSCGSGKLTVEPGAYGHGAWDLGRSDDWAAVACTFPIQMDDGNFRYESLQYSFTCQSRGDDVATATMQRWIDDDLVEEHWGDQIDFSRIGETVLLLHRTYQIRTWAYDPTFSAQLAQELHNEHGLEIFPFTQAAKFYNEPIRTFLRLLNRRRFCHGDDPVFAWQARNLVIRKNAQDQWMPDKANSSGKIDALVSVLMSLSECLFHESDVVESDDAGITVI